MSEPPWHTQDAFWTTMSSMLFGRGHLDAAPVEIEHVLMLLGVEPGARVLDLCCGVGRHSLELAPSPA